MEESDRELVMLAKSTASGTNVSSLIHGQLVLYYLTSSNKQLDGSL